jgi:hypothetical protein
VLLVGVGGVGTGKVAKQCIEFLVELVEVLLLDEIQARVDVIEHDGGEGGQTH